MLSVASWRPVPEGDRVSVTVRKFVGYREEIHREGGREADGKPLVKVVPAAVISNPVVGRFQEDVSKNFPASVTVGEELTERAFAMLGGEPVESYGKGAIVGADGDQEQCVSFLTTAFGDTLRGAVDGSELVSSVTKRGARGSDRHTARLQGRAPGAVPLRRGNAGGPGRAEGRRDRARHSGCQQGAPQRALWRPDGRGGAA